MNTQRDCEVAYPEVMSLIWFVFVLLGFLVADPKEGNTCAPWIFGQLIGSSAGRKRTKSGLQLRFAVLMLFSLTILYSTCSGHAFLPIACSDAQLKETTPTQEIVSGSYTNSRTKGVVSIPGARTKTIPDDSILAASAQPSALLIDEIVLATANPITTPPSNNDTRNRSQQPPMSFASPIPSETSRDTNFQALETAIATGNVRPSNQLPPQPTITALPVPDSVIVDSASPHQPEASQTSLADDVGNGTEAWPTHGASIPHAPTPTPDGIPNTPPQPTPANQPPYQPNFQDPNANPNLERFVQEARPWNPEQPISPERRDAINEVMQKCDALL